MDKRPGEDDVQEPGDILATQKGERPEFGEMMFYLSS